MVDKHFLLKIRIPSALCVLAALTITAQPPTSLAMEDGDDIVVSAQRPNQISFDGSGAITVRPSNTVDSGGGGGGGGSAESNEIVVERKKEKRKECVQANLPNVSGDTANQNNDIVVVGERHGALDGTDNLSMLDKLKQNSGTTCLAMEVSPDELTPFADGSASSLASSSYEKAVAESWSTLVQGAKARGISVHGVESANARDAYFITASKALNRNAPEVLNALDVRDSAMAQNIQKLSKSKGGPCNRVVALVGAEHAISKQGSNSYRPNNLSSQLGRSLTVAVTTTAVAAKSCAP